MGEERDAREWSSAAQCVFDRIAEKWTLHVIARLAMSPMHFLALHRSLAGVSKKVLTETLRRLERDGLVTRRPEPDQTTVEYSLTALGQSLRAPLDALRQWSEDHVLTVEQARQRFDTATRRAAQPARRTVASWPSIKSGPSSRP